MIIRKMVTRCDVTEQDFKKPVEGFAVLARSGTGQWCEVMWVGPQYGKNQNFDSSVLSYEDAVEEAQKSGSVGF